MWWTYKAETEKILDVHVSVHRTIFVNDDKQDATIQVYLIYS